MRRLEGVRDDRRVVSIRNLKLAMIIVLVLLALPLCLDGWQGGTAIATTVAVRHWLWCPFIVGIEDSSVRAVEVTVCKVRGSRPFADSVTSIFANVGENVRTNVPAA
jgi:hypothetical protein